MLEPHALPVLVPDRRPADHPTGRLSNLAPRLGHGHDLQQVAVRVLEVEAAPASTGVDLAVRVAVWPAAVWDAFGLHPGKDRVELRVADMEGVVMALARPGVEPGPTPWLGLVGEVKGQAVVDLHLREVALAGLDCQAEDLGEEPGGGDLVLCWHNRVIQPNRHCPPPDSLVVSVFSSQLGSAPRMHPTRRHWDDWRPRWIHQPREGSRRRFRGAAREDPPQGRSRRSRRAREQELQDKVATPASPATSRPGDARTSREVPQHALGPRDTFSGKRAKNFACDAPLALS